MNLVKTWLVAGLISLFLLCGCGYKQGYYDNVPTTEAIEKSDTGVYKMFTKHTWTIDEIDVNVDSVGTCFAYGDYIITARHVAIDDKYIVYNPMFGPVVIERAELKERRSWIVQDGEEITLELVVEMADYEVAIFKKPKEILTIPYAWGKSEKLEKGDWLYVTGHAFGYESPLIVSGILAGRGEPKAGLDRSVPAYEETIAINLEANPGHSGSPIYALRNGKPELVGVVNASIFQQGLGFGMASDVIMNMIDAYKNGYGYDE